MSTGKWMSAWPLEDSPVPDNWYILPSRVISPSYTLGTLLALADVAAIVISRFVVNKGLSLLNGGHDVMPPLKSNMQWCWLALFAFLLITAGFLQGGYSGFTRCYSRRGLLALFSAYAAAAGSLVFFLFLLNFDPLTHNFSRENLFSIAVLALLLSIVWRMFVRWRVIRGVKSGFHCRRVLIAGDELACKAVMNYLQKHPQYGFRAVGFASRENCAGSLGTLDKLADLVYANYVDEVFVADTEDEAYLSEILIKGYSLGIQVRKLCGARECLGKKENLNYVGSLPFLCYVKKEVPIAGLLLKRLFDVIVSALGLLVISPVLLVIAVAISLDSRGPVFDTSLRVGKNNRHFNFHKFRCMVAAVDLLEKPLSKRGLRFNFAGAPKISRIGQILRKYNLDELPQLWNVLRGEMSLVGPRPPLPCEDRQVSASYFKRLRVIPGITGLWQVSNRQSYSLENHIRLDNEYIDHWSILLDLKILLRTFVCVCKGTGN